MSYNKEYQQWLDEFETIINSNLPIEKIVDHFVMMGVEKPNHNCVKTYNQAIHKILYSKKGLVPQIKKILMKDLCSISEFYGYGKIARYQYSRELINYFLIKKSPWI